MSETFPGSKNFKKKHICMSKPENDLQVTIRMPSSLKQQVDDFVAERDITSMEFIRRAIREKLSSEQEAEKEKACITEEEFRTLLLDTIRNDTEVQNELRSLLS